MVSGLIARARSLWQGVRRRSDVEAEMQEEFRLHLELRTADLIRAGLSPDEATRRARIEFGSIEQFKDEGRGSRGLRRVDDLRFSLLDLKLGVRMLVRYPGLTLVGGLAMAFAIWLGAGAFELLTQVVRPTLPLPDGDRIVAIRNWDAATSRPEPRALHDFVTWRRQLRTVQDVGAYRTLERNLIIGEGRGEPVEVAEITASAFRVARVRPLLGRALVDADEQAGAPPVVVLGHDVWQRRFAGDPSVIGRVVRLGTLQSTVVGVMPERFGFPVAQNLWMPFRLRALDYSRRQGPAIQVFGRLARGASLDEAQAELATVGKRVAADFPETHAQLRPVVMPYAKSIVDVSGWRRSLFVMSVNVPLLLLILLVCGNVGLLMFARAATRESEIVVRTALGASRRRIVMQLFAEALVLGSVAVVVGLAAAGSGMRWVMGVIEAEFTDGRRLPFWFEGSLSETTVLYAVALTVLAALIGGVVPGLKVTRAVGSRLKEATAGGGGLRFGGVWTVVIVAQVAVTVAFPAVAMIVRRDAIQIESTDVGFPDEQFLTVHIEMDEDGKRQLSAISHQLTGESVSAVRADSARARFVARFQRSYEELERRVLSEPGVVGVTYGDRLPRMYHPHRLIEVDEGGSAPLHPQWPAYRVSSASVDPNFIDVVDAPVLAGRGFTSSDHASTAGVVIVNRSFVERVLGGRNPIGRRLRYVHFEEWSDKRPLEPGAWYEIVGVVRDMAMAVGEVAEPPHGDPKVAGIYHPVGPGGAYPTRMAVHLRGDPIAFTPRLRAIATAVDPTLRLYNITPLDEVNHGELKFLSFWFRLLMLVSSIALGLSLAGIYSVMAFTVSRRTREIGIRIALGANRRKVVTAIFARPFAQVGLGIAAGAGIVTFMALGITGGTLTPRQAALLVGYVALMMSVCMLACIVPTRRALGVEPTEALRAEG